MTKLEYNRAWRAANAERYAELQRRHYEAHRERRLLWTAKKRAKRTGVPFTIVESDIVIPTHCPALGIPLFQNSGKRGPIDNSPTIDRLRAEIGYVPDNIRVISWRANRIKNDATVEELEAIASWLRRELEETQH